MTAFEYYEFRALDRSLTKAAKAILREFSTRALITSALFTNKYHFGSFKGDVEAWMERYFDAFLYNSNWGTRRLILRFSNRTIDPDLVKQYCQTECARYWTTNSHIIVDFEVAEEGGEYCEEEEDAWSLDDFLDARVDISLCDYRLFYLGWLLSVQYGNIDKQTLEPPVPHGLRSLSPSLQAFVDFFRLDKNLLRVAAYSSDEEVADICLDDIEPCLSGLTNHEKFNWLCRLALDDNPGLQAEFRQAIVPDCGLEFFSTKPRRSVSDIQDRACKPINGNHASSAS